MDPNLFNLEPDFEDVAGPSRNINNPSNPKSHIEQLLDMQAASFGREELTDAEIHVQDKIFKVNRYFLCLHSDVFFAYLNSDSIENKTGTIRIDDLDPVFVEAMLRFMYSGKVDNLKEIAHDLYVVADRYDIKILKQICLENMFGNLDMKTILSCLELAFQLNIEELKQKSIEFALKNAKLIQEQSEWEPLVRRNPDINITFTRFLTQQLEELQKENAELKANQCSHHHCPHHRCNIPHNHQELLERGSFDIDQFRAPNVNRNRFDAQYRRELEQLERLNQMRNNLNNGIENVRLQQRALRLAQDDNPAAVEEGDANRPNRMVEANRRRAALEDNNVRRAALEDNNARRARELRRLMNGMNRRAENADPERQDRHRPDAEARQRRLAAVQQIQREARNRRRDYPFEDDDLEVNRDVRGENYLRRRNEQQENLNDDEPIRFFNWHEHRRQNNNNQNNQNNVPPEPVHQLQVIEISDNDEDHPGPVAVRQNQPEPGPNRNRFDSSDDDYFDVPFFFRRPPQEPVEVPQDAEIVIDAGNLEDEGPNQVPQEPREQRANEQGPAIDIHEPGFRRRVLVLDSDDSGDEDAQF